MDFKSATDELCDGVSHDRLASVLGVSVAAIRQARLQAEAKAHRRPPAEWERAVIDIAEEQVRRYSRLIRTLRGAPGDRNTSAPPARTGRARPRARSSAAEHDKS